MSELETVMAVLEKNLAGLTPTEKIVAKLVLSTRYTSDISARSMYAIDEVLNEEIPRFPRTIKETLKAKSVRVTSTTVKCAQQVAQYQDSLVRELAEQLGISKEKYESLRTQVHALSDINCVSTSTLSTAFSTQK
ncbi:hypothetical protein J4211_04750 [Candidatus Woesearchaeota archaeon]|nr:hypothetical protein [Candidatus Woesearchaeota archaeon]